MASESATARFVDKTCTGAIFKFKTLNGVVILYFSINELSFFLGLALLLLKS